MRSGDLRQPFLIINDADLHSLIDRAYDAVLESVHGTAKAAASATTSSPSPTTSGGSGAGSTEESSGAVMTISSEHLREWALLVLNPDNAALTDEESAAADEAIRTYTKRQGLLPPRRVALPRSLLHAWSTVTFFKDVMPELAMVREAEQEGRRRALAAERAAAGRDAGAAAGGTAGGGEGVHYRHVAHEVESVDRRDDHHAGRPVDGLSWDGTGAAGADVVEARVDYTGGREEGGAGDPDFAPARAIFDVEDAEGPGDEEGQKSWDGVVGAAGVEDALGI